MPEPPASFEDQSQDAADEAGPPRSVERVEMEPGETLRRILQNVPIGIFQSTFDQVTTANPAMARMFGYAGPEEMIASPAVASHLFADPCLQRQRLRKARDLEEPADYEVEFQRKDGSPFIARLRLLAVRDVGEEIIHYEGYVVENSGAGSTAPRPAPVEAAPAAGQVPAEEATGIPPVKLLIVDDHAMLRKGLRETLARNRSFEVIGEAATGAQAVVLAKQLKPDVILMDVHLPDMTGLESSRAILDQNSLMRVIIFSSDTCRAYVDEALIAGVSGYLSKTSFGEELKLAIDSVMSGSLYLSPGASAEIFDFYRKALLGEMPAIKPVLSERDKLLLQLVANGRRNKEISDELGVSTKSVEAFRSRLQKKLGCSSSAELVRYAVEQGLVKPSS